MSNHIKEKTNQILNEINQKLLPENLKKDVKIFNTVGILEQGPISQSEYDTALLTLDDILGIKVTNTTLTIPGEVTNQKLKMVGIVENQILKI